jgi:YidC/Oxa1 family membrane protein insertase
VAALIALAWWQALLDGLGAVLAFFYQFVPNYGVAIILLTLAIRVLLLPLAFKQIRSMQAMQVIQPKVKELQRKFKGNRERLNQEMMALYKEKGVNPLSGCLPILAQFPVLIALFAVLQFPLGLTHIPHNDADPIVSVERGDSQLYVDLINQKSDFLGVNLLCSAAQAGGTVKLDAKALANVPDLKGKPPLDCGSGIPVRIPYYIFALLMMGTTYIQQRQMQKASPGGSQQQQMMTRIMPILFGVWGFIFPAGLVVYWTTTNAVQIVQQYYMLSRQEHLAEAATSGGDGRKREPMGTTKELPKAGGSPQARAQRPGQAAQRPTPSGGARGQGQRSRGGRNAGSRKKRRKR